MDLKALRAKLAEVVKAAKEFPAKAKAEKRDVTADELEQVEKLLADADGIKGEITAEEKKLATMARVNELDAEQSRSRGRRAGPDLTGAQATQTVIAVNEPSTVTVGNVAITSEQHDRIQDDPKRGFRGLGEFSASVHGAAHGRPDERLLVAAAGDPTLQQSVATDGGFLVPPAFSMTIWEGLTASRVGSIMGLCDLITIPDGVESITFPANAETSRANGSRGGGIQGYWKSELGSLTSSRPTFREVKYEPNELYVFVYASDKLLRNASILEQYMNKHATEEIRFKVEDAIINGTGSGQPRGIMAGTAGDAGTARVQVAKETGQAADTIVRQNVTKMWQRTLPQSQGRGVWLYDTSCQEQLSSLTLTVGTGGVPVYMPPGGLSGSAFATIYGRPAMPCEYCGAVGDAGDLIFADLGAYGLAVQGGVQSAMSMHLKFDFAQTAFRFIFSVDGQPWLSSAITPFSPAGGTTKTETLSSFTTIAARA